MDNLVKTPLMAVFYASVLSFSGVFIPYSEAYATAAAAFQTPLAGYLLLLGYALLVSVITALAFSTMKPGGLSVLCLGVTMLGFQWVIPAIPYLWYGERQNLLTRGDLLLNMGRGALCTVLLLVLALLLLRRGKAEPKPAAPVYRLKTLGLVFKMLALPFLYLLFFFADWYYLGWQNSVIRLYEGGGEQAETLIKAILEQLLLKDPLILPFTLFSGLILLLFMLPLMTRLASGRASFAVITALLVIAQGSLRLLPVPWLAPELRFPLFVRDTALALAFCVISAVLLHLSYHKQAALAAPVRPAPSQQAAGAKPAMPGGVSAKQAAAAVQNVMQRRQ